MTLSKSTKERFNKGMKTGTTLHLMPGFCHTAQPHRPALVLSIKHNTQLAIWGVV